MIETIRQGLQADGITVSISKLCRWFEVPRRSVYYRPVKAAPTLQGHFVAPDPVAALGGQGAQRALGHGYVPCLGRA